MLWGESPENATNYEPGEKGACCYDTIKPVGRGSPAMKKEAQGWVGQAKARTSGDAARGTDR